MTTLPHVVLTVDAARARLFRIDGWTPRGLCNLVEVVALAHPEARVPGSQRHSDSNPRSVVHGSGYHTLDDHREEHEQEERRRFAKMVAVALSDAARPSSHVVVCVTHSMQSVLREALERHCPRVNPVWYPRECTLSTSHELSELLTDRGLLPQQPAFDSMNRAG